MPVILIGYRGTGKTTVARLIATQLGCDFFDADAEVEQRAGKTIKQVFEDDGEPIFRDLESQVLTELIVNSDDVLALGGGVVIREENRKLLESGTVVWLTATPETIHARVSADHKTNEQRPNLTTLGGLAEIKNLLDIREPIYRGCADFIVPTDGRTPDEVAKEVVSLLRES